MEKVREAVGGIDITLFSIICNSRSNLFLSVSFEPFLVAFVFVAENLSDHQGQ